MIGDRNGSAQETLVGESVSRLMESALRPKRSLVTTVVLATLAVIAVATFFRSGAAASLLLDSGSGGKLEFDRISGLHQQLDAPKGS